MTRDRDGADAGGIADAGDGPGDEYAKAGGRDGGRDAGSASNAGSTPDGGHDAGGGPDGGSDVPGEGYETGGGPTLPRRLRIARRFNRAYHRRLGRRTHDLRGIDVVAADWDVLVVLDACRPDVFAELVGDGTAAGIGGTQEPLDGPLADAGPDEPLDGPLADAGPPETRRSRGSHTVEWLWGNLANRELHDLVYVTANVQPEVYADALDCHHVEHAWLDGFEEASRTVPPPATTDAALAAAERFPRKRLVVHYLQPHYPFRAAPDRDRGTMAFWRAVAGGDVDVDRATLRDWHADNLAWVLPEVERLLDGVAGRAVVTSDHATALGERVGPVPVREWGHPWGIHAGPLTRVPWLEVAGERRETVADDPVEGERVDEAAAREKLAALGYA